MKTKLIAVPIPAKYKWRAKDHDGDLVLCTHKMHSERMGWEADSKKAEFLYVDGFNLFEKPKDWRNTLERIVEIEYT